MNIRPAELADLGAVFELERAAFGDVTYPDFFFRQAFDLWRDWFLVSAGDNAIVGYALGAPSLARTEAWLVSLAVHESARGKGVGRALVAGLLDAMRRKGITTVRLTVHPDNPALSLYLSLGFIETERQRDYFHADDPRVVMSLPL